MCIIVWHERLAATIAAVRKQTLIPGGESGGAGAAAGAAGVKGRGTVLRWLWFR